jgi:hypothetical protein
MLLKPDDIPLLRTVNVAAVRLIKFPTFEVYKNEMGMEGPLVQPFQRLGIQIGK